MTATPFPTPNETPIPTPTPTETPVPMPSLEACETPEPVPTYELKVYGGTGSGRYHAGDRIKITPIVPAGKAFAQWNMSANGESSFSGNPELWITMQNPDMTVTAIIVDE